MTDAEAAKLAGIAVRTIRTWRREGLKFTTTARLWHGPSSIHIAFDDLHAWMCQRKPFSYVGSHRLVRAGRQRQPGGIIYALLDPKDGGICYIGQSVRGERRVGDHLSQLKLGQHSNQRLQRLFDKRVRDGLGELTYTVLATTESGIDDLERQHIADARQAGRDLCNSTDGGEFSEWTEEARAKQSELNRLKWQDPVYRANWQAAREASNARRPKRAPDPKKEENRRQWQANMAKAVERKAERDLFNTLTLLTRNRTAFLPLTHGQYALIDDSDVQRVQGRRWYANWNGHQWRAISKAGGRVTLRSFISGRRGTTSINGDDLDCRKRNLETHPRFTAVA